MSEKYFFDKRIFRGVIVALLLFFGLVLLSEGGFGMKFSYDCPKDAMGGFCNNPFYKECYLDTLRTCVPLDSFNKYVPLKYQGIREFDRVPAGFHYGDTETFIYKYSSIFFILIVLVGFVINHLLYNRGKGHLKRIKSELVNMDMEAKDVMDMVSESPNVSKKRGRPRRTTPKVRASYVIFAGNHAPITTKKCMFCDQVSEVKVEEKRLYETRRGKRLIAIVECNNCHKKQGVAVKILP